MAAGEGTRMRSSVPKVLHEVCGRALVAWPVLAARAAGAARVAVIVSAERDLSAALPENTETIVQPEPDGTGGAIRAAIDLVRDAETVVVLPGDHALVSAEAIGRLLEAHSDAGAAATLMTTEADDPGSYGRVVRDANGDVERIAETKHRESVSPEILAITEISTAIFAFQAESLADALGRLSNENEAHEYYLGDVLPVMREAGLRVAAHTESDERVNLGINTRADLAVVESEARHVILREHMLNGVTVRDPGTTWVDADVEIEPETTLEPGTVLRGATRIGAACVVGPHSTLVDSTLGAGVTVVQSHLVECDVDDGCTIGPFTHLRPGASLHTGVKAGAFVEIKKSEIGEGAKVPHLSYVGDADIGAGANVGAGTITANYDGFTKSRTKIGERARIAVHTSLVAPVAVGDDAYTGAGAVVREDVPPGALAVTKGDQRNIEGYAAKRAKETEERRDS
jgi:bifunctional UDP-N-acetylglucosamine pyrophosphorylase/glucosamine-1-phosphate N-acetyltransferase